MVADSLICWPAHPFRDYGPKISFASSHRRGRDMSRICQVTGKKPSFGNNVSHSHRKTNRRWDINIQKKRYYLPSEMKWISLTVSAKGIKTIDKRGIESVVAEMRRNGQKI